MSGHFFYILLLIVVALLGALPHSAMADDTQKISIQCHIYQTVMSRPADTMKLCNVPDHSMCDACAIACLGSVAHFFPAPLPKTGTMDLRPVTHTAVISVVLRGRMGETAEKPPKSIGTFNARSSAAALDRCAPFGARWIYSK